MIKSHDKTGMTPDRLALEAFSPVGETPVVVLDLAHRTSAAMARALKSAQAVVIGVDCSGDADVSAPDDFDILLTSRPKAAAPWVQVDDIDAAEQTLVAAVQAQSVASSTLRQILRLGENLSFEQALIVESLAYSTLLGGQGFADWRAAHPSKGRSPGPGPLVLYDRCDDEVILTLNRPQARNAVGASMRDALFNALCSVIDDPTAPSVTLTGAGPAFSAGGDLDEFGSAIDLGQAHIVRAMRSPTALVHALGARARVILHGACIGAGIEIGAAAAHRIARPDAFFQLPEIAMGLVPGAGGTVSVTLAIGRHRTMYMALSGARIDPVTALDWGLVHAIEAP